MSSRALHLSGIRDMLISAAAFSAMGVFVKLASRSLPALEIVFFRSLIGTLLLLAMMIPQKASLLGQGKHGWLILRGVFGFVALSLSFYAISKLPLGTAVILNYMSQIFTPLLAIFLLKEKPTPALMLLTLVSFLGVYFLVGADFSTWNLAVLMGILSALFAAFAYVMIRMIREHESPMTVILYFTVTSSIGSLFYLPFGFVWPSPSAWFHLLGVGGFSFAGQYWMTLAYRKAPTAVIGPFAYAAPLCSFMMGMFFFDEHLTLQTALGAGLIILGGSLISILEAKRHPA